MPSFLVLRFALLAGLAFPIAAPSQTPAIANDPVPRSLRGRVLDENGYPLAGMAVSALPLSDFVDTAALLAAPATTTAADGTWHLRPPDSRYLAVTAIGPGRMARTEAVQYDLPSQATLPDLLLLPGAVLTGGVHDAEGKAIAGARVLVSSRGQGAGGHADAAGRFAIPGVPATGLRVWVTAPGYFHERCFAMPGEPLEVTLQASGLVRGRVVSDRGKPVENVSVLVHGLGEAEPWFGKDPTTSADGSFAISIPCRGPFRLIGWTPAPSMSSFTSELLHGPAEDVVIRDWPYPVVESRVLVECEDAAGAPIPVFFASWQEASLEHLSLVVFGHLSKRRECRDSFAFAPQQDRWRLGVITVDAPGFARQHVAESAVMPSRLRITLGPEATLSGTVLDAETRQPVVGAAVLALPAGMAGSPPAPLTGAVLTDASGHYRIGNLPGGEVAVQVFAAGRPASAVQNVSIATAAKGTLDLLVPPPLWLTGTLRGTLPPGAPGQLTFRRTYVGASGCSNPLLPWPGNVAVSESGAFRAGPVDVGPHAVSLWLPSRVDESAGRRLELGTIDAAQGNTTIVLPALQHVVVRGRVHLPASVPAARVLVRAQTSAAPRAFSSRYAARPRPDEAQLAADGSFAFDLPAGPWWFQLVDLATGVVFAWDLEPRAIADGAQPIEITPELHWLELELAPTKPGGEVLFETLNITVPAPRDRDGKVISFANEMETSSGDPTRAEHRLPIDYGTTRHRWLVPRGQVSLGALQYECDARQSRKGHTAGSAVVEVVEPVHAVRMEIAPLPFAKERLLAPQR